MQARRTNPRKAPWIDAATAISIMIDRIVESFDPKRIILFGSQARGTATPWSDVDLMVVMDDLADGRATTIAIRQALSDVRISKDIVVTTQKRLEERSRAVGTVHRAVMREGKTVYERQV